MVYPVIEVAFSSDLSLVIPDADKIKATYEMLLVENSETKFPFWAKCWPASLAMFSFLQDHPHYILNKNVLELGAGIGLPSFLSANQAASVIISDYAEEAVELMNLNIDKLQISNAQALKVDWNNFQGDIPADTVLLSDINYDDKDFESLKLVLNSYLQKGATILLATPNRINASSFVTYFSLFIQKQELIPVQKVGVEVSIGLFVLEQKWE